MVSEHAAYTSEPLRPAKSVLAASRILGRRRLWRLLRLSFCAAILLGFAMSPATVHVSRAGSAGAGTSTPVKHLVVIFQENESFDHYFGTYPGAANPSGEPPFTSRRDTPSVNGLTANLIANNPNLDSPFRVGRLQSLSCFENGRYQDEQAAVDGGRMDKFVQQFKFTSGELARSNRAFCPTDAAGNHYATMGYVDGNTVTALWNYAQNFAMSDNFYNTTYGPSTLGAINLVAATTGAVICGPSAGVFGTVPVCAANGTPPFGNTSMPAPTNGQRATLVVDEDPLWDICSREDGRLVAMASPNIGDALTNAGVTWGWFEGGFGDCSAAHPPVAFDLATSVDPATDPFTKNDYTPHHQPFQFYASTANPQHLPPSSVAMIGGSDQANHQYDLSSFWQALDAGNLPAVSFLKAPTYQDSHAGYSDPLDEQQFLVATINRLQQSNAWSSTAVVITYDDSNGYYDHVVPPIVNRSATSLDRGCGSASDNPPARCGYGQRLPFLIISPFSRRNYIGHTALDQTSITRFIEDNWLRGSRLGTTTFDRIAGSMADLMDFAGPPAPSLLLDPDSGQPVASATTPPAVMQDQNTSAPAEQPA
jgi:phospholipase C